MPSSLRISPSILSANPLHFGEDIRQALDGGAELIHMDVMDGHFVPNLTIGPHIVEAMAPMIHDGGALVDVHLMIESPEKFISPFACAGADIITIHIEACRDLAGTLQAIRFQKIRAGFSIRPKTPLLSINAGLPHADLVLVMSVEPGFGGQPFLKESVGRIRRIRELLDGIKSSAELEVDGGIGLTNAADVAGAGASILVAGNSIFKTDSSIAEAVRRLRAAAVSPAQGDA